MRHGNNEALKLPGETDEQFFARKRQEAQQRMADANGVVVDNGRVYIVPPGIDNVVTTTQRERLG